MRTHHAAYRPTDRVRPEADPTCENSPFATTTVEPFPARPISPRAASLYARLSARDLSVLQSLAALRLMSGFQIQRLQVADGSDRTQARRARALLQRLADLKLVVRLGRRVGGVRAGSSGYIYGLSGNGQAVLGLGGPYGGRRRRVWETSPAFQDHILGVAEIYVALVEAERRHAVEILDFEAEPSCWRRFPGSHGQVVTLKPDAFVRLGIGEDERSSFLEVDRGTESPATIARKCKVYIDYWRTGTEQAHHEVFPSVLWLATSSRAASRISKVVRALPDEGRHLFDVVLLTDAGLILTAAAQGGRMV